MSESFSTPFAVLSSALKADLNRAVRRYVEIERLCTTSGCACGSCLHIDSAIEVIGLTVLHHAGLADAPREATLPEPRAKQTLDPVPRKGFVYVMKNHRNGFFKIGFSTKPEYREATLQAEEPEISLVLRHEANQKVEELLHQDFAEKRVRGEWFRLSEDDLSAIQLKLIRLATKSDSLSL